MGLVMIDDSGISQVNVAEVIIRFCSPTENSEIRTYQCDFLC